MKFGDIPASDIRARINTELTSLGLEGTALTKTTDATVKTVQFMTREDRSLTLESPRFDIARKIDAIVEAFAPEELTKEQILAAAQKDPALFFCTPKQISTNIRDLAERFAPESVNSKQCLKAALRHPQLFGQDPETLERNVRDLARIYEKDGFTPRSYVEIALKQPSLFSNSPATIAGRIDTIIDAYKNGLVIFRKTPYDATAEQPLKPMFDFLATRAEVLTLGKDNLELRAIYAAQTGMTRSRIYKISRKEVEEELRARGYMAEQPAVTDAVPEEPAFQLPDESMWQTSGSAWQAEGLRRSSIAKRDPLLPVIPRSRS